jgi:opacity protein-like surface antigen
MNQRKIYVPVLFLFALLFAAPAAAQNFNRFTFNIGGGFTQPVRNSEGRVDKGFNVAAGAGVNLTPHLGIIGEFGFNNLDLTRTALLAAGVPAGSTRIYSVTANPILRFNPRGRFDAYLTGGGGFYRRTVEFTEPTVATVTVFDPFWGAFFPAAVPADRVLGSFTQNKGGWNIGGGVSFRVSGDSNTKIFAEAKYHHILTDPVATTILPVTFGLRW